jgi:SAM-dependent methyltransferase
LTSLADYKTETRKAYDQYADIFAEKFQDRFETLRAGSFSRFAALLRPHSKILDVGAGPGVHAKSLQDKGHAVTCVDISQEMVNKCLAKGLKARVMDLESLDFAPESFDAVLTLASLLHVPKNSFPHALNEVSKVLKRGGLLWLILKEGVSEGFEESPDYPGTKRWFSYYKAPELKPLLEKDFEIISLDIDEFKPPKHVFLSVIARKR